jgi:hypothetical protein
MLPALYAERQLLAIEAASVPHMSEHVRRELVGRYARRVERAGGETKPRSAHEALLAAGVKVAEVPAKPRRGRRDKQGHDERGRGG